MRARVEKNGERKKEVLEEVASWEGIVVVADSMDSTKPELS